MWTVGIYTDKERHGIMAFMVLTLGKGTKHVFYNATQEKKNAFV